MNDQRTFAMFCTYWSDELFLFAEVADEIAAVAALKRHVAKFGESHVPDIHMEPMRAEWSEPDSGRFHEGSPESESGWLWNGEDAVAVRASFGPSLFRQPARVSL